MTFSENQRNLNISKKVHFFGHPVNHFYSLAVKADIYGDAARVVGSLTKIINIDRD